MTWCRKAIEELASGADAVIYPRGGSMRGLIDSGSRVVVSPVDADSLAVGDIVLVRCSGRDYLHLIKAIDSGKGRYLIGNNRGGLNGWVGRGAIYGKATQLG